jgi:hypothetical protein
MAIEGHKCSGKKNCQQSSIAEVDKELTEIRARMEELPM